MKISARQDFASLCKYQRIIRRTVHFDLEHFLNMLQRNCAAIGTANIAQMVNVLQAMILTDGPRMTVPPTYWVFEMYKVQQGATALPVELATPGYKFGDRSIPAVSASASRGWRC